MRSVFSATPLKEIVEYLLWQARHHVTLSGIQTSTNNDQELFEDAAWHWQRHTGDTSPRSCEQATGSETLQVQRTGRAVEGPVGTGTVAVAMPEGRHRTRLAAQRLPLREMTSQSSPAHQSRVDSAKFFDLLRFQTMIQAIEVLPDPVPRVAAGWLAEVNCSEPLAEKTVRARDVFP